MDYGTEVLKEIQRRLPRGFDLLCDGQRIAIKGEGLRTSDSLVFDNGVNHFSARRYNRQGERVASSVNEGPDIAVDNIIKWLIDTYKERKQ